MIIGLIGPPESVDVISKLIKKIDDTITINCYVKETIRQLIDVIEPCEQECDAIIFTGCAVSNYIAEQHAISKPYTFIGRSICSVVAAFVKMLQQDMALDAFSIDIVETQVVEDLLDAFSINAQSIYSSSFQHGVDEKEYIKWHMQLQDEKKTNIALTSLVAVYKQLKEKGYHVLYLAPTLNLVRESLNKIKKECALSRAEYSMVSVELFKLKNIYSDKNNYYNDMIKKTKVEKYLIEYIKTVQGAMFPFGRDEYIVFSNSGVVKIEQNYNNLFELQKQIKKNGFNLFVGVGIGITAYKAELNARKAMEYSIESEQQEIFQIDENHVLESYSEDTAKLKYCKITSNPQIQSLSENIGLSVDSILKIISISQVRQSYTYDANELADCLNITIRSARRIMNKIISAGYGTITAKEISAKGGRPKSLVEFDFKLQQ